MKNYLEIIPESVQLIKMTDEEYFSDKYKDHISNSKLSLIDPSAGGSPEKFKEGFTGGFSESFELGSAVHGILLQPDEFYIPDLYKPTGKMGYTAELVKKYRDQGLTISESIKQAATEADYYKGKLSPKRLKTFMKESVGFYIQRLKMKEDPERVPLFLSKPTYEKYQHCLANIEKDGSFINTLYPEPVQITPPESFNEYAILCEVKISGEINKTVKVKAKIDNFVIDEEKQTVVLNDVKTTGFPIGYFMGNEWFDPEKQEKVWIEGSFEKFRYYRQLGMYLWLLQAAMQVKGYKGFTYRTNMLVVETRPEYMTRIYSVKGKWIKKGLQEFKHLLILAANE